MGVERSVSLLLWMSVAARSLVGCSAPDAGSPQPNTLGRPAVDAPNAGGDDSGAFEAADADARADATGTEGGAPGDAGAQDAGFDPSTNPIAGGAVTPISSTGFTFLEGPTWVANVKRFFFTDVAAAGSTIYELKKDGSVVPFRSNEAAKPDGLSATADGKIVAAEIGATGRRVVAFSLDGSQQVLATALL